MKMSDVFKLPMLCEDGDGALYSDDLRHEITFDDSDTNCYGQKIAVAHAINNHDRLEQENLELRDFANKMINDIQGHDQEEAKRYWRNKLEQLLNKER